MGGNGGAALGGQLRASLGLYWACPGPVLALTWRLSGTAGLQAHHFGAIAQASDPAVTLLVACTSGPQLGQGVLPGCHSGMLLQTATITMHSLMIVGIPHLYTNPHPPLAASSLHTSMSAC
jgi:hypothetical protein